MNTHLTPPKEDGYRFVNFNETLQDGDEFWDSFCKTWGPITEDSIGYSLDLASVGHFRRAV